jgi:dienelactone hydrolase
MRKIVAGVVALLLSTAAFADMPGKVIDITTRPGVSQRFLLIARAEAKAAAILFVGSHGGLQINDSGALGFGRNNFLVRAAPIFAEQGVAVALIDAPSDRQGGGFLTHFRESPEHAADVRSVIAWLREQLKLPVWLIGTSRGTQSVAAVSTRLATAGADGIVLTSTLFSDRQATAVPEMEVQKIRVPVLVVHHEQDGCRWCAFRDAPRLMNRLTAAPRKELIAFRGGENQGDPCGALAYHGYNGLEREVTVRIAEWMRAP